MSTCQTTMPAETVSDCAASMGSAKWYAVQTRSRHEKFVSQQLLGRGVEHYLPLVTEVRRWSDRQKQVELPLFSGYVFVHVPPRNEERVRVLRTNGVVRFVGSSPEGTPISEEEIKSVRTLMEQDVSWVTHPFLQAGQRVRIRGGALDGVEGIFQAQHGDDMLVVAISTIQRALSVSLRGYDVEPI